MFAASRLQFSFVQNISPLQGLVGSVETFFRPKEIFRFKGICVQRSPTTLIERLPAVKALNRNFVSSIILRFNS